uniref:Pyrroline-5-carboxylate reductase dimerisation domain-containing protein n=1 Tax=Fagus sylvatica TaxID=28930 RepID=A0A2N9GGT9_FAGSY
MSLGGSATEEDADIIAKLFGSVGKIWRGDEKLFDAVTGLSGSGPAYIFLAIEALADGGVAAGLPRELALGLASQTVLGAASMATKTGKHPGQLKDDVTSPGGTTIAGIHELEKVLQNLDLAIQGAIRITFIFVMAEMVTVVVQNSGDSSSSGSHDEWLNSIMKDEGNFAINQKARPKIQKVPEMLREIKSNEKCYDPWVVSIGPYHHGSPRLQLVEKHKIPMTRQYVMKSGRSVDDVYNKVVEVVDNARKCYAEGSTQMFDDKAFSQMMFLDGCFILQFMYCIAENKREDMGMKSSKMMKEKSIINNFIEHTRALPPLGTSWMEKLLSCIPINIWEQEAPQPELREVEIKDQPVHLLELIRGKLIDNSRKNGSDLSSDWYSYRSAKELRAVGVNFKPGKTHLYTDVKFKSTFLTGKLTLPPITVDDSTKSLLLNLVAYETCPDAPDDFGVTSYICFMDSLIDHAEDVMVLRSEGILLNFLGSDQEVADLFNAIAKDLVPNPYAYAGVKGRIERHYRNKLKIWMAEWLHTHFSSPWTILAFIAAIFAIALSVVQTYYAANPPKC